MPRLLQLGQPAQRLSQLTLDFSSTLRRVSRLFARFQNLVLVRSPLAQSEVFESSGVLFLLNLIAFGILPRRLATNHRLKEVLGFMMNGRWTLVHA